MKARIVPKALAAYGMILALMMAEGMSASGVETEPDVFSPEASPRQETEGEAVCSDDPTDRMPPQGEILAGPVELNDAFDSLITDPMFEEEGDASTKEVFPEDGIADSNELSAQTGFEDESETEVSQEETDARQENRSKYRYEDSMTFPELAMLPEDIAGAATVVEDVYPAGEKGGEFLLSAASLSEDLWTCSDYYVNEPDLHRVEKKEDFSLKYQIEFHTSTDLDARSVEIRVPQELLTGRGSKSITPFQIGVPAGTRENPVPGLNSPFNWYLDDSDGTLIFFNYRAIDAGTNTAFQVLYHPVRITDLVDGSVWSVVPVISVHLQDGSDETQQMDALEGVVDSKAQLNYSSADVFSDGSIGCLPAMYTKNQVQRVLGTTLPAQVSAQESEWLFIAWQIDFQGEYNQPWSMSVDAALSAQGVSGADDSFVVGSVTKLTGTSEGSSLSGGNVKRYTPQPGSSTITELSSSDLSPYLQQGLFHLTTTVVTAVRRASLSANSSVLGLSASSVLTPADGIDPVSSMEASASWTFVEYQWKYKGDDVGIFAWTGTEGANGSVSYGSREVLMSGWINEFLLQKQLGQSAGSIPVRIRSECRGYSLTHETGGALAGSYIPGSGYEVTTVDDVNYLAALSGEETGSMQLLGPQDYYYSDITVTIQDRGMDIFEERLCAPMSDSECPGADRSTRIFVMYEGSADWELAAECPWNSTGKITYTFPKNSLGQKIWRVKVIHHAVDYDSTCTIDSRLCIKPQSPVCESLLPSEGADSAAVLKAEHLGSVLAKGTGTASGAWFHDYDSSHYENAEPGLSALTMSLYGIYSMRANCFAQLSSMKKHARALKTITRENDPENGCLNMTCTIGALEGYRIYSAQAAQRIVDGNVNLPKPDRSEYIIYDLLPEGVQFDPSSPVRAGLVMGETDQDLVTPSVWNSKDVSVRIDPSAGVCRNWRNTGRELVIVHVSIRMEKEQIPRLCQEMWLNGVGVQFGARCLYKDIKRMKTMPNIAAVMPGSALDDPMGQILGADSEVAFDDGVVVPYTGDEQQELEVFGADIDSDGITNLRTVLYAYARSETDTALSLTDGIGVTVRADLEAYSDWEESAHTGPNDPYTYRIDVTNSSSQPITEIVIGAHLETGALERALAESGRVFDSETWIGSFVSADTGAAQRAGIVPVVWLNEDPDAPLPGEGNPPDAVLTAQNGWILSDEWTEDPGKVRSVAVELREKTDGSRFELGMGDNVHIFLHMTAPGIGDGEGETRAQHAYQCASFYSISQDEPDGDLVQCNAVEVTLDDRYPLIVEKELTGEVRPEDTDRTFLFCLIRDGAPVPYGEYRLEEKRETDQGETVWEGDDNLHTTGKDGTFSLKNSQRAVFEDEAGGDSLTAKEIRSAFYEEEITLEQTLEGRVCRFENSFHPTLYLTKKVFGAPDGTDYSSDVFLVKVLSDGRSMAGMPYWTVNRTDGLVEDEVLQQHTVDENSCVSLHAGEVIALHPGEAGCTFEVTEEASCYGDGTDYAPVTVEKSGILLEDGNSVILENAWRWKDLILRKEILHQGLHECGEVFSFRLWRMREGNPASSFDPGNPSRTADPAAYVEGSMDLQQFSTDEKGCFRLACAGKDVRLNHLEALASYVVEEIDIPAYYEPLEAGLASVTMPLLSGEKTLTVKNTWKKRSLEVSKTVLAGLHQNRTAVFTPGYPGLNAPAAAGSMELFFAAPAGMRAFTIVFPREVNLVGDQRLRVQSGTNYIDTFSGTIAAGETRTYTGYSDVSFSLWGMTSNHKNGFFFWFLPDTGQAAGAGENISGKTFTFLLEKEDGSGSFQPCPDTPYLTGSGGELRTDSQGRFFLEAGQKAVFADLGAEGERWRVSETPDLSIHQVYPSGAAPQSGLLGEGGEDVTHALFINGEDCQGMFRKQYTAAEGDEAARDYLEAQRLLGADSALKAIFLIEGEDGSGNYAPLEGTVLVADALSGELLTSELYQGKICLSESQTVILTGIQAGRSWRITEMNQACFRGQDLVLKAFAIQPSADGTAVIRADGTIADTVFTNELHSVNTQEASLVCKAFRSGDREWEAVPDGAVLAFCLERFEDGIWRPAQGVDWVQLWNRFPLGENMNRTGADGIIRVRKENSSGSTYLEAHPVLPIAIGDGSVKTELYYALHEAQEGDLRIRELMDLSDPSFGMLTDCDGNTFINENEMQKLVVEKQTGEKSDQQFSMKIVQYFGDAVLPGKYLSFLIRDCETGEVTGSSRTDAQGSFSLKGGYQAQFSLAQGTKWEVVEKNSGSWHLASCTMEQTLANPQAVPGGIRFEMASIRRKMTLTSALLLETLRDPFSGQVLDFTSSDITIPHYIKKDDEIWEITRIDDNLFERSSLRSVTIEDGITYIGAKAFNNCSLLESVRIPNTLVEIGKNCFTATSIRSLEFPASVTTVGKRITNSCRYLTHVIIHQNEAESVFRGYEWLANPNITVEFTG